MGLSECFEKAYSENLAKIYWRTLKHYTEEDLAKAFNECVLELEFFPRLPRIIERLPKLKQLENKGSLSWCDNTQKLLDQYGEK